jgi:hypothetical protein
MSTAGKSPETQGRLVAAWGWVENGKCLFVVSFRDDENVLEWGGGGGGRLHSSVGVLKAAKSCSVLCDFHLSWQKR